MHSIVSLQFRIDKNQVLLLLLLRDSSLKMYDIPIPLFGGVIAPLAVVILVFVTLLCKDQSRPNRMQFTNRAPYRRLHPSDSMLDVQHLSSELQSVTNWYQLGIHLGLETHELDKVQMDYAHQGNDRQRLQMLDLWLQRTPNGTQWEDVVRALQLIGKNRVAENIRQHYIKEGSKLKQSTTK